MTQERDAEIAELRRELTEVKNLLFAYKNNGLDHLFAGHGYHQVGRNFRFNNTALQIRAPSEIVSLLWLADFVATFDQTQHFPHVSMNGLIDDDTSKDAEWFVYNRSSLNQLTEISAEATATEGCSVALRAADGVLIDANLRVFARDSDDARYVQIDDCPLWLNGLAADPTVLSDGMLWYRSDTDELKARINGSTVTLATTADIPTSFDSDDFTGTEWTDLTDGGATTLHTHAASGWNPTVTTQTGTYSAADNDFVICNSASAFTVTLPTATANVRIVVKNINTGAVTIDGAGSDTIDGVASIILGTYDAVSLIADGSSWHIF